MGEGWPNLVNSFRGGGWDFEIKTIGLGGGWTESCWKGFGKAWPSPLEIYRVVLGWGWVEIGADKHYGWGQGWNWVKSSAGDGVGMGVGLEMG